MASVSQLPVRVVPDLNDSWQANIAPQDRKAAVTGFNDSHYISENETTLGDSIYVLIYFGGMPEDCEQVTAVSVRAYSAGPSGSSQVLGMYIDGELVAEDAIELILGTGLEWITFEDDDWNGPWSPERMSGAYFKLWMTVGKSPPTEYVDQLYLDVTYTSSDDVHRERRGAAAIRLYPTSSPEDEVADVATLGVPPGLIIQHVSAMAGEGQASIRTRAGLAEFKAPGSSEFGTPVPIDSDGYYLLEDGDAYAVVRAFTDYVPDDDAETVVSLKSSQLDDYDANASEMSVGDQTAYTFYLRNLAVSDLENLRVWLGDDSLYYEASDDGSSYVRPTTEDHPDVLEFDDVLHGGSAKLWLRRTIPAGADKNPAIPLTVCWSWKEFN